MSEKDYNLLRPFDLEAAKAGGVLNVPWSEAECRYVAGPHPVTKEIVVEFRGQAGFMLGEASDLRMAPLCWVEGRPVYAGDTLYFRKYDDANEADKHYADRLDDDGERVWQDRRREDSRTGYVHIKMLTWSPLW